MASRRKTPATEPEPAPAPPASHAAPRSRTLAFAGGAPGEHMALNGTACLALLHALGLPLDPALALLGLFRACEGRGATCDLDLGPRRLRLIDEAYNANPASMAAAIALLREIEPPRPGGRRVMVLGDMLELGAESAAHHAALAPLVEAAAPDLVLLCGPEMKALHDALPPTLRGDWAPDADALLGRIDSVIADGDLLLVKSSAGTGLSALVRALKGNSLPRAALVLLHPPPRG